MPETISARKSATLTWRNGWATREEKYVVEDVIGHEMIMGTPHYRVKWQGWPGSANTWEPIGDLGHCEDLIEGFHQPRRRRAR